MRFAIALGTLAVSIVACGSEVKPTRALVEVYSDYRNLAALKVEVSELEDPARRETGLIPVSMKRDSDHSDPEFLLSFAVAPRPGREQNAFLVEITGLDAEESELVWARGTGRFMPGSYTMVRIKLALACDGVKCPDRGETCSDEILNRDGKGQCAPIAPAGDGTSVDGSQMLDASAGDAATDVSSDAAAATTTFESESGADGAETGACNEEGALRCAASGSVLRQRCEGGGWADAEPCPMNAICDQSAQVPGTCRELLELCRGSAGQAVCEGAIMQLCDANGAAAATEQCKSPSHCEQGRASRKCLECLPGEYRCAETELEICADDGRGFVGHETCASASLCRASAGTCTDAACVAGGKTCMGDALLVCNAEQTAFTTETMCDPGLCDPVAQECDMCTPGASTCQANAVRTCNPDGQGHTDSPCTAPKSVCTGSGVCVQCTSATNCPAPASDCQVASCDVANGTCGAAPLADHSDCQAAGSTGVCRGGTCIGCIDSSDCQRLSSTRPICSAGTCVTCMRDADCTGRVTVDACHEPACVSNTCATRVKAGASCGSGRACNATTGACENACGNGRVDSGEECDHTASGWDNWSCNSQTCKATDLSATTSYHTCANASSCSANETCKGTAVLTGWQLCIPTCSNGFCPIPPGYTAEVLRVQTDDAFCNNELDDCFVKCGGDGDCPGGLICAGGICRAESL